MSVDTLVVGGGIAGLSCAFTLQSAGREVLVLEADEQAGGNVRTMQVEDFRIERGPHSIMASAQDVFDLVEQADLTKLLAPTAPSAHKRFIVRDGRMHAAPTGLLSFAFSGLLSLRGKMKLAGEPFRTRRGLPSDTAMDFFDRRFGPEAARVLAGAFISGVYAGDPASLSAPAAFPLFWGFEQESGGMIRGAIKLGRQRKAARKAAGETGKARSGLYSFAGGLGSLTSGLARQLGERVETGQAVRAIRRESDAWIVETDSQRLTARQVVVAVPPAEASRLLGGLDRDLGDLLSRIPMAPVAVVHMGHRRHAAGVPDGFGFLAPRGAGIRTLGILFPSRLFADRAPAGGDLLTAFIGGMLDRPALDLADDELLAAVMKDLEKLTGFNDGPDLLRVARYPQAIPQFTLGHLERMAGIHERLESLTGLCLAGNYLHGVGLKDAVASGLGAAEQILGALGNKEVAA